MHIIRENLHYILLKRVHFLFILFSSLVFAQGPVTIEEINKQFDEANLYVTSGNPEKAFPILDQIRKDCESIDYNLGITRIGHTLAIIYFNSSDYKKVINLDDEYLKLALKIKDYEKLCHIHRIKGSAYTELGLFKNATEERLQALNYAKKMKAGNSRLYAMSLIYSNLAGQYITIEAVQDSVFLNLNKSIEEAEKISEESYYYQSRKYSLISYSYLILANEYSKLNKPDIAEDYYLKTLEIHNTKPIVLVERVVLLSQLGFFYYNQNKYDKAIVYAELGLAMEKTASFPHIRKDLFETLSKSYLELQKTESSKKYLSLFIALNDSISSVDKKAVDSALNSTISKQEKTHQDDTSRRTLIYMLSSMTLIVFGISFFFYYKRKKHKQIKKIEAILENLKVKHRNSQDILLAETEIIKTEEKEEEKNLMSVEAEKKLLEKLHDFEEKKLFLEKKVSLPYVAAEIESNTKYLSYIIKNRKGKDFNKYINDLRIDYIVQKLNDDPVYRKYKINFLAEETGFSSHSKFANVFKNTLGVSPSEFINYLEERQIQEVN